MVGPKQGSQYLRPSAPPHQAVDLSVGRVAAGCNDSVGRRALGVWAGPGEVGSGCPPNVSMMQATDFGNLHDRANLRPLDRPYVWRILTRARGEYVRGDIDPSLCNGYTQTHDRGRSDEHDAGFVSINGLDRHPGGQGELEGFRRDRQVLARDVAEVDLDGLAPGLDRETLELAVHRAVEGRRDAPGVSRASGRPCRGSGGP